MNSGSHFLSSETRQSGIVISHIIDHDLLLFSLVKYIDVNECEKNITCHDSWCVTFGNT